MEFLALLGEIENSFSAKIIDLQSLLERVIKIDGGRTIEDHFNLLCNRVLILLAQPKFLDDKVSLDGKNLAPGIILELLFATVDFPQPLKAFGV